MTTRAQRSSAHRALGGSVVAFATIEHDDGGRGVGRVRGAMGALGACAFAQRGRGAMHADGFSANE